MWTGCTQQDYVSTEPAGVTHSGLVNEQEGGSDQNEKRVGAVAAGNANQVTNARLARGQDTTFSRMDQTRRTRNGTKGGLGKTGLSGATDTQVGTARKERASVPKSIQGGADKASLRLYPERPKKTEATHKIQWCSNTKISRARTDGTKTGQDSWDSAALMLKKRRRDSNQTDLSSRPADTGSANDRKGTAQPERKGAQAEREKERFARQVFQTEFVEGRGRGGERCSPAAGISSKTWIHAARAVFCPLFGCTAPLQKPHLSSHALALLLTFCHSSTSLLQVMHDKNEDARERVIPVPLFIFECMSEHVQIIADIYACALMYLYIVKGQGRGRALEQEVRGTKCRFL